MLFPLVLILLLCVIANDASHSRLDILESKLNDITIELEKVKRECKQANATTRVSRQAADSFVAFAATIAEDMTPIAAGEVIIFNHVVTTVGGGYDPYIGRFKAPVAGYYHFVVTIISYGNHYVEIEMVKEGLVLCRARASQSYNSMGTCASNTYMTVGEDVWIRHFESSGDAIHGQFFPSFSGHLIKSENTK